MFETVRPGARRGDSGRAHPRERRGTAPEPTPYPFRIVHGGWILPDDQTVRGDLERVLLGLLQATSSLIDGPRLRFPEANPVDSRPLERCSIQHYPEPASPSPETPPNRRQRNASMTAVAWPRS